MKHILLSLGCFAVLTCGATMIQASLYHDPVPAFIAGLAFVFSAFLTIIANRY